MDWNPDLSLQAYVESSRFRIRLEKLRDGLCRLGLDEGIVQNAIFDVLLDALDLDVSRESPHTLACFSSFESENSWWRYLAVSSKRRAFRLSNRNRRQDRLSTSLEDSVLSTRPEPDETAPAMTIEDYESLSHILSKIDSLPGHFPALVSGIQEGKTYTEIARQVGVSKSRISRMIDELPRKIRDFILAPPHERTVYEEPTMRDEDEAGED